jgi:tetratricopeptide (TPR) repeat protein
LGYGDILNINLTWYEWVLSFTGYLKKAHQINSDLRARSKKLNHIQTTLADYCNSSVVCSIRKEPDKLLEVVNNAYPLGIKKQELFVIAFLKFFYGYANLLAGKSNEFDLAFEGLNAQEAIGNRFATTFMSILLAEILIEKNSFDRSDLLLEKASMLINEMGGECFIKEEYLRIKGDFYLAQGIFEKAFEYYHQSIELAKKKNTKLFELRSSNCLANLLIKKGKSRQALDLVSGIYKWFPEGEDSVDIIVAKALITGLETNETSV